jgi:hypothetical protein
MAHTDESVPERTSAGPALADPLPSIATPDVPIGGGGLTAESLLALQRSAGNQGVARMLGQAQARASAQNGVPGVEGSVVHEPLERSASLRRGRCPDGSCTCEERDEEIPERPAASDAALTARHARAKSLGDGVDRVAASDNAPVDVVIELVAEDADAGEASQEGAGATAGPANVGARQKRGASMPVGVSVAQVQPGPVRFGPGLALRSKATTSVAGGAAPTRDVGATDYGLTIEEAIVPTIGAKKVSSWFGSWFGSYWYPVVTSLWAASPSRCTCCRDRRNRTRSPGRPATRPRRTSASRCRV